MEITYLGHSSFKIKGKTAAVVTDPFSSEMVGFKFPKTEADIVTISHQHQDHNHQNLVEGNPFIISEPGEYEVKGVSVFGYPSFHDSASGAERGENIIYVIETEGLRICHLGDLGSAIPPKTLEEISDIDVLMIPVGGVVTIGPKEAVDLISQIEPNIVLPMHYRAPGIDKIKFGDLATLDVFLKEMGAESSEKLDKISLTKDKLPVETKVVLLERKN